MRPSRYAGKLMYEAGANGTVTLEPGDRIVQIYGQSAQDTATVAVFGGTPIPVPGDTGIGLYNFGPYPDDARFEATAAAKTVVFTNTQTYFIAWMRLRPAVPV